MGHYHGFDGFLELSKLRPVFKQPRISALETFYPPYTKTHPRLFELLLRFKR